MVEKTVDETDEVSVDRSLSNLPRALVTSMVYLPWQSQLLIRHIAFVMTQLPAVVPYGDVLQITFDACEQVVVDA